MRSLFLQVEESSSGFFFFSCLLILLFVTNVFKKTQNIRFYLLTVLIINGVVEYLALIQQSLPLNRTQLFQLRFVVLSFCLSTLIFSLIFSNMEEKRDSTVKTDKKLQKSIRVVRASSTIGDDRDTYIKKQIQANPYRDVLKSFELEQNLRLCSKQFAQFMDSKEKSFRSEFYYPVHRETKKPLIYLCGNSLGLQPKKATEYVNEELKKWAEVGVEGHFIGRRPWFNIEDNVVSMMAKVVGAKPIEVAVCHTLTVNEHLLLVSFYRPSPNRYKILMEENPFPSDMHAITSHIKSIKSEHKYDPESVLIQIAPREGEHFVRTEDILDLIEREGNEIALILLGGVQFMSGQAFDFEAITRKGHEKGCIVGFDLAHGAGNIDLKLHDWEVDFACWCTYKYLNSGPGNLGGIFIHEKYAYKTLDELPRFAGWWGHKRETRFSLTKTFDPQPGAASWQLSNPIVLGMVAVEASLEIFDRADINKLRQKSFLLTTYLEMLLESEISQHITILTPRDPKQRGCQLSLRFNSKPLKMVMDQLKKSGVVCDEREPDIVRISPAPLYNTFEDVYDCVMILKHILTTSD